MKLSSKGKNEVGKGLNRMERKISLQNSFFHCENPKGFHGTNKIFSSLLSESLFRRSLFCWWIRILSLRREKERWTVNFSITEYPKTFFHPHFLPILIILLPFLSFRSLSFPLFPSPYPFAQLSVSTFPSRSSSHLNVPRDGRENREENLNNRNMFQGEMYQKNSSKSKKVIAFFPFPQFHFWSRNRGNRKEKRDESWGCIRRRWIEVCLRVLLRHPSEC